MRDQSLDRPLTLQGPAGFGERVEGELLVSRCGFSPRYDLHRDRGVISRRGHDLEGEAVAGKIVVFTAAKGGVAAGWALYDLVQRGIAPLGFVFETVNPVFVQGCVVAGIPIVHQLWPSPTTSTATGQRASLDPRTGRLVVTSGQLGPHRAKSRARIGGDP